MRRECRTCGQSIFNVDGKSRGGRWSHVGDVPEPWHVAWPRIKSRPQLHSPNCDRSLDAVLICQLCADGVRQ